MQVQGITRLWLAAALFSDIHHNMQIRKMNSLVKAGLIVPGGIATVNCFKRFPDAVLVRQQLDALGRIPRQTW